MNRTAARNEHFRAFKGDFAERFLANGGYEGFHDVPELFAPLLSQYRKGRERIKELSNRPTTPEERRERENLIRICGSWAAQLREGSQMAFERMFLIVAQARLPKEHMLVFVDEARALWRGLGFDKTPPRGREVKKAIKRRNGDAGLETHCTIPKRELPE